jgi:hypothetical protein
VIVDGEAETEVHIELEFNLYSNEAVAFAPLAFAVPFKVTDVLVKFVAEPVIPVGTCNNVVKLRSEPY